MLTIDDWRAPGSDEAQLPGQYLARDAHGTNPGRGYVRIALVPELEECLEAGKRIVDFCGLRR